MIFPQLLFVILSALGRLLATVFWWVVNAILIVFGFIGILSFVANALLFSIVGGSATTGHVDGGRYFLSNRGDLFEVSEWVYDVTWFCNWTMVWCVLICLPLGILSDVFNKAPKSNEPE